MSLLGQSRPSNSVSGPPFVRCWSNSDHSTAEFVCPLCAISDQRTANRKTTSQRPLQLGTLAANNSAGFDQCDDLGDDFPVEFSWRNLSLPMGTYSHSQRSRVHWASGKLGTLLPEYSTPNCVSADAHAFRPGRMRTPRNNPNLCELLSARSARAICDGFLCIGALISVAPGR